MSLTDAPLPDDTPLPDAPASGQPGDDASDDDVTPNPPATGTDSEEPPAPADTFVDPGPDK